jgi:hypothetical protein
VTGDVVADLRLAVPFVGAVIGTGTYLDQLW